MRRVLAGIGSRTAPREVLAQARLLARDFDFWWRSGHAEGMDYAFEQGAGDHCIVYLPWATFNTKQPLMTRHVRSLDRIKKTHRAAYERAKASVAEYHPNPDALRNGGFLCMARNYLQVMGLDETPVDGVVCWTKQVGDKVFGGTAQAIRIARDRGIPVWNLYVTPYEEVREALEELASCPARVVEDEK